MRDPQRISVVLEALRQAWQQNPDLRLGQLLFIAASPKEPCPEFFHIEDDKLLAGLQAYQTRVHKIDLIDQEISLRLGEEFDLELLKRLREHVRAMGGTTQETEHTIVGSQETVQHAFVFPSGTVTATSETYCGLTIRGPAQLVQELSRAIEST
jgi:uncharacterized protein YihD (DUF1040 family)